MSENLLFWKSFSKRSLFSFFTIIILFFISILRLTVIATTEYSQVQTGYNKLTLTVAKQRGTIFDRNMIPLTNNEKKIIAAVSPTPRAITALSHDLSGEALNKALERLKSGKPILCEVPREIKCDGIICTEVFENSENMPAAHILGYTDSDSKGISGLQKAYDNILYSENSVQVLYECSGKGDILEGVTPIVKNDTSIKASGVVTTLDINIQNIAEKAAENISKGAIVVADAKSGKIRACVSRPYFNPNNVSEYIDAKDSPLLNRAINAYNVGSVFKPCVAAAGIEKRKSGFVYHCTGNCLIADRYFKCHKYNGHGEMNLCSAIANSCNTFFYNFSFNIGGDAIFNTARKLRFGSLLKLCDGIYTSKGNLPQKDSLGNIAHLANFSIGQGELLLSPISILPLYCAIASGGEYYIPSLVEGIMNKGRFEEYNTGSPTKAMEKDTADMLKNYLVSVLTEGTGKAATPKFTTAAGKTATAQTGKYENGVEICQGWFCGFFPAENPEYVAVCFSENTQHQKLSCAEIFAFIADEISLLE